MGRKNRAQGREDKEREKDEGETKEGRDELNLKKRCSYQTSQNLIWVSHSRPRTPIVMNYNIISTTGRGNLHSLCYHDSSHKGQMRGENPSSQLEGVVSKDLPGNFYNTTS